MRSSLSHFSAILVAQFQQRLRQGRHSPGISTAACFFYACGYSLSINLSAFSVAPAKTPISPLPYSLSGRGCWTRQPLWHLSPIGFSGYPVQWGGGGGSVTLSRIRIGWAARVLSSFVGERNNPLPFRHYIYLVAFLLICNVAADALLLLTVHLSTLNEPPVDGTSSTWDSFFQTGKFPNAWLCTSSKVPWAK